MENENKRGKIQSEAVKKVEIDESNELRISKSMKEGENVLCVDVRMFKLYPIQGHYDNKFKATGKGVHFSLDKLPDIINGLIDIYEDEYGHKFNRREENE